MLLSEEIAVELQKYGVEVAARQLPLPLYGGVADVLEANGPGGHGVRILPIEIECRSEEDAARQSDALSAILVGGDVVAVPRDRWERQREMMLKRLLAHCGIFTSVFARNCEVRRIDRPTAQAFMEANHSYGHASCRYCYGLYSPAGTLVAASEFSNVRRWQKEGGEVRSYEWIRYASLPEVRVSGGMGKILRQFIADVSPDDIMSYADLEWSDGRAYRTLGFVEDGRKAPVLFRIDPSTWTRTPLSRHEPTTSFQGGLFYQNFGSLKYRLSRH